MGCDLPVAVGSNLRHEFDLCNLPFPRWDLPSYSCGTRNRDPSEVAGHHFLVHSIDMFLLLFLRKTFQWMLLYDKPFFNFLTCFLFSFFFLFSMGIEIWVFFFPSSSLGEIQFWECLIRKRKEWIYTLLMRLSWEISMYIVVKFCVPLFRSVVLRGCLPS